MEIIKQNETKDNVAIYTYGKPMFDDLTKTEKRLLLLPLVETIRNFYKDPINRQKFEQWKAERQNKNPA